MASLKDIRQKIKGVSTTQQITGAMKMMSTARLSKAMETIKLTESYISKYDQMVHDIKRELPDFKHSLMIQRPVKSSLFIVVGGERSLCGGFNAELNKFALSTIQEHESPDKKVIALMPKTVRFFKQHGIELYKEFPGLSFKTLDTELFTLTRMVLDLYKTEQVDEVFVIYTSFVSAVRKYLTAMQLLPVDINAIGSSIKTEDSVIPFDFYPSPEHLLDMLMPRYLHYLVYRAIIESSASEQSARMTAMTSATDRAQEIIDDLNLDLNRSRQALITTEISEIISGSQN